MISELKGASEILVVALTLLGEAEGETYEGKRLVADTIYNRAHHWPVKSYRAVCLKKWQYSCWNYEHRQRRLMDRTADLSTTTSQAWKDCIRIARELCTTRYQPTTQATHYFNPQRVFPDWARNMQFVTTSGNHDFYMPKHGKEAK